MLITRFIFGNRTKSSTAIFLFFYLLVAASPVLGEQTDDLGVVSRIKRAEQGDAKSALWLAHYFEKSRDFHSSHMWLKTAARFGNKAAIVELGYDTPYVAYTSIVCGNMALEIKTFCSRIDQDAGLPLCYLQHIHFHGKSVSGDLFLLNQMIKTKFSLARQAKCLMDGLTSWIAIESSNLGSGGSCIDCERTDFFNNKSGYAGSIGSLTELRIVGGAEELRPNSKKIVDLHLHQDAIGSEFEIVTFPTANDD